MPSRRLALRSASKDPPACGGAKGFQFPTNLLSSRRRPCSSLIHYQRCLSAPHIPSRASRRPCLLINIIISFLLHLLSSQQEDSRLEATTLRGPALVTHTRNSSSRRCKVTEAACIYRRSEWRNVLLALELFIEPFTDASM